MTYTFFLEIIVETFHCVGSQHANVHAFREPRVVSNWIYLFTDKVGDFISDLKTQNELLSVSFVKFEHQTAISTADVEYLGHWPVTLACSRLIFITNWVLLCVYDDLVLVIVCYAIEGRKVEWPVDKTQILRHWHTQRCKWINVSVHPMVVLLRHVYPLLRLLLCSACRVFVWTLSDACFLCRSFHSSYYSFVKMTLLQ